MGASVGSAAVTSLQGVQPKMIKAELLRMLIGKRQGGGLGPSAKRAKQTEAAPLEAQWLIPLDQLKLAKRVGVGSGIRNGGYTTRTSLRMGQIESRVIYGDAFFLLVEN